MFDPKDSKTVGYHLFFLPPKKLFTELQDIIDTLAERYDGIKLEPHVTLLARIPKAGEEELMIKTRKLAGMMRPFEIEPKTICAEEAYFRALYCKTEYSPELKSYHQEALNIFGIQDVNIYFPHLSLYYGSSLYVHKNEAIASLSLPVPMKFIVDKVFLYRTEGEADSWVKVGECQLSG